MIEIIIKDKFHKNILKNFKLDTTIFYEYLNKINLF